MKTYNPQISVLLIKAERRKEIAPGLNAIQSRYDKLDNIDLTPFLDKNSLVQVTKSTRSPTGTWSIRFADKMHSELFDTIYALCAPMDLIEIRMAHDPIEVKNGVIPLVMRGFVTTVGRSESMNDNVPQRYVTVSGHDFMKILQIYRVVYRTFSGNEEKNLQEFKFFQTFADSDSIKNMSGNEFAKIVVNNIVNPYMADIAALTKVQGSNAVNQWGIESSIDGSISASAANSFEDVSLYEILSTILDIGAWNEMYMDDTELVPTLTIRPVPFKDVSTGEFIQGKAPSLDVYSQDILSMQVSRDDSSVSNFFWVSNNRMAMQSEFDQRAVAQAGDKASFIKFDYLNSNKSVYGIKMLEYDTLMSDPAYTDTNAATYEKLREQGGYMMTWVERRRKLLADMNKDNVILESGSIMLRGQNIKPGIYLNIHRGANKLFSGECYAHTITHSFAPFNAYTTSVQFDRGTFFATRAQFSASPYIYEIEKRTDK